MNQSEDIYNIIFGCNPDKEPEILQRLNQATNDLNEMWEDYDIFLAQCFFDAIDGGCLKVFRFLCENIRDKRRPCPSSFYQYALFDGDDYAKEVFEIAKKIRC